MIIANQRIRIGIDTTQMGSMNDVITGATPQFWNGVDLQFELAVFFGAALAAVSNLDSLTVDIKASDPRTGVPVMSATIASGDLNNGLTLDAWLAGAASDCHALVTFTNTDSNLDLSSDTETFWLVISALTNDSPAHKIVLNAAPINVMEGGEGVTPPSSVVEPTYYTAAQSDARYTLAVDLTSINTSISTLNSEMTAVTTTANAAMPKAGGTFSGAVTITGLSGVLKAPSGVVTGSATTSDLPEGTNLYWTSSRFSTALAAVAGAANGVCPLDSGSLIPAAFLPSITVHNTFVVASQAAMLALAAHQGDVAIRTDINQSFILTNNVPAVLGNWSQLLTPASAVTSVNSLSGTVTLTTTNIAEGANLYFTTARANTAALATALTGFSNATGGSVTSGDTILVALGRLENRVAMDDAKLTGSDRVLKAGDTMTGPLLFSGSGNAGMVLSNLTDTQRAALTPAPGTIIYDTSLSQAMIYNGSWQGLATGSGTTWFSGSGAPGAIGVNGNYYLNTATGDIYLLSAGVWSIIFSPLGGSTPMPKAGGTFTGGIAFSTALAPAIDLGSGWSVSAPSAGQLEVKGLSYATDAFTCTGSGAQINLNVLNGNIAFSNAFHLQCNSLNVVGPRATGWTAATGTATRTSFATGSVSTANLAQAVKALIDDLIAHGLIGTDMTTITGTINDADGQALHATIDFVSKSTPLVLGTGLVITNTDKRIKSNPSDGTFSIQLQAGNYQVTIAAEGQSSTFNIAVPDGTSTFTIDQLVSTPLVYPFVAPNTVWNGQWAGSITFLPLTQPAAPTGAEISFFGGNIEPSGNEHYAYWVSWVTPNGETQVSPVLNMAVGNHTAGVANKAIRVTLPTPPASVTAVHIWRTFTDTGSNYVQGIFPANVGLLTTVGPNVGFYDDFESTTDFAGRVDATLPPLWNTTAGQLLSSSGTPAAFITDEGLFFPGTNVRVRAGVGLQIYNFTTKLWYTLLNTGAAGHEQWALDAGNPN